MRCTGTEELSLWERGEPRGHGHTSCVLTARWLQSTCFFLAYLWFSSTVFKVPSGTYSALCTQMSVMVKSEQSRVTHAGPCKTVLKNLSLCGPGLQGACFSANSRRDVCNVSLGFLFDIFIENAKMQYRSL